jgi:PAS domain S-box-containing protein
MLREAFIENAAEPLPVMLWRARPDLSCEYVSRQWLDFTGCSEDQALGDGWSRSVHPEDLARWLDTCVSAFDAREPYEIEYRLRRRDGEHRWVLDRAMPRYSKEGRFLGFVGTCIDIDERKRAEHELSRSLERERRLRSATEEASRLKDGFLASVLSDLRSPARAIAGWAKYLRGETPMSGDAARALDAIEHGARAQDRLISSLLDLSSETPLPRAGAQESLLSGVRVLIVDGDPDAREAMSRVLGIAGAETKAAASSSEALETLKAFRPDVMLSDAGMQSGDARSLVRAVRLTPGSGSEDGNRAVAAGCDARLAKPVEPVALLATVARLAQPAGV